MARLHSDAPLETRPLGLSRILIVEYWLPLLLWLLISFIFSTEAFSQNQTSRFLVPFLHFVFPGMSPPWIDFCHLILRKSAHVTEYFILGVLAYRVFHYSEASHIRAKAATILFVLCAALSDEAHQLSTLSRSGSLIDVGYDCAGAVLAVWFLGRREKRAVRDRTSRKVALACRSDR